VLNPNNPDDSGQGEGKKWGVSPSVSTADDVLLNCLTIVCKLLDRPQSREALASGLPIAEQGMSPSLFIRAANRAGIASRLMVRPLDQLTEMLVPCVLLLRDRKGCVMVSRTADSATVIFPETGGTQTISIEKLEGLYTGYVLFAKPEFKFDSRAKGLAETEKKTWFWGTLRRFKGMYMEVVLASLMVNLFALASPLFIMNVYDRVIPNHAMETLWVLATGAVLVFAFDFIIRTVRGHKTRN
jgi:ATP-binding cassette subfamily C protein LapB